MRISRIDHYNIRTLCFAETVRFYEEALGMQAGPAPMAPQGSRPSWLYDNSGNPLVHLTSIDPEDPSGHYARISGYRGNDTDAAFHGSGAIDHMGLACEGYEEFRDRFTKLGIQFVENSFPEAGIRQIFVRDPNGITLELNFTEA